MNELTFIAALAAISSIGLAYVAIALIGMEDYVQ